MTNLQTHCEIQSVPRRSDAFPNTVFEERGEVALQVSVLGRGLKEAVEEEEEAVARDVVASSVDVGPAEKDIVDPF